MCVRKELMDTKQSFGEAAEPVDVDDTIDALTPRDKVIVETKLEVLEFYHSSNLYQMSKKFDLNTKTILRWAKDENKIRQSKKGASLFGGCEHVPCVVCTGKVHVQCIMCRRTIWVRNGWYPDVETQLYEEYKELRRNAPFKGAVDKMATEHLKNEMH